MKVLTLKAVANQKLFSVLGGQNVDLLIRQKGTDVFVTVSIAGTAVVSGVLGLDRNRIVRESDGSFIGDLTFFDSQGFTDPDYKGFGTRYFLAYIEASDDLY